MARGFVWLGPLCAVILLAELVSFTRSQDAQPVCSANQLFNGQICTCAPGYFSSNNDESKARCEDECEEVYFSYFTYGACVKGIFDRVPKDKQPPCNLKCGMRIRLWASIGVFCVFAAAVATLIFTIPMCIATCASCLHSRKASKHSKRVYAETQAQPSKEQQLQTMSYNPYAYWPYYGRG
ncbi:hypothetical protein DdX_07106 [Ditylenchus destructor]|uniref:Uncharacterized protein n=1 Tax=Ditylenchus destructor TaxID=166010 RepID=A0AAD4N5I0_9BILA|nr:hypothetical protein DdX_07106 [Ditylenchus destructor]